MSNNKIPQYPGIYIPFTSRTPGSVGICTKYWQCYYCVDVDQFSRARGDATKEWAKHFEPFFQIYTMDEAEQWVNKKFNGMYRQGYIGSARTKTKEFMKLNFKEIWHAHQRRLAREEKIGTLVKEVAKKLIPDPGTYLTGHGIYLTPSSEYPEDECKITHVYVTKNAEKFGTGVMAPFSLDVRHWLIRQTWVVLDMRLSKQVEDVMREIMYRNFIHIGDHGRVVGMIEKKQIKIKRSVLAYRTDAPRDQWVRVAQAD